jgi:undecaprenyl-diphosphatase
MTSPTSGVRAQETGSELGRLREQLRHVHPVTATIVVAFAGYVALAAFTIALGALVTNFVERSRIGSEDVDIARWFANHRTGIFDVLSDAGSRVADTVSVPVILGVSLVILAVQRYWPLFALLVVSVSVEASVYLTTTYFISRDRPPVPRLEHLIRSDSYFSGHIAAAVALYGCLAVMVWVETNRPAWRALVIVLAVVIPIIVGTSRVYRGMHFPTDALAGALVGVGCIAMGYLAAQAGVAMAQQRRSRMHGGASLMTRVVP